MKLRNIATIKTGMPLARNKAAIYEACHAYKQLTLRSFSIATVINPDTIDTFLSIDKAKDGYLTQANDIVIRLRDPGTAIYINKSMQGLIVSSLMCIVRTKVGNINAEYLAYYLNSSKVQKVLAASVKGMAIPMIRIKDIAELVINLPTVSKQEKIVKMMQLLYKEQAIIKQLSAKKRILTQNILDTISNQLNEAK